MNTPTWTQRVLDHLAIDPAEPAAVTAVPEGAVTCSRAELLALTAGALDLLDAAGVPPGEDVPALLSARPQSLALLLAGAASGRPLAPLAPRMTQAELRACLAGMTGSALLCEPQWADLAHELVAGTGRAVVLVDGLTPSARTVSATGGPDAVVLVMHTSGTTGLPRPVRVREAPLAVRADVIGGLLGLTRGSRLVTAALFHHVGALGNITASMANGTAVVSFPTFTVEAWRSLRSVQPTHAVLIPTVIEMLLSAAALDLPSLQVIGYGGSPIHPDTMRRVQEVVPNAGFVNLFGQTEGSPLAVLDADDHRRAAAGATGLLSSVGRAAPGVELRLNDADATGTGEVWARCRHSFVVDEQGWQRTGDLGRLAEGYLYLVGRRGDKIIRGGENVYPLEVEQVLQAHPAVAEAAVVGVPDQRLGEAVKAFLVLSDPAAAPDLDQLRAFARRTLSGFKVPEHWEVLDALPRNPSGKVVRSALTGGDHGAPGGATPS